MNELLPFSSRLIILFSAIILLISFAMLAQRRISSLINLFALQGFVLTLTILVVAIYTGQGHLYWSALITVVVKVVSLPWVLKVLIKRLNVNYDVESLINVPTTMLVGLILVVIAFNVSIPISKLSATITNETLGIALASILLAFLMMIVRTKAIAQVIGFLSMENGLFLAATSTTYGMPMIVELGVAFDVLIATVILGVFFFQIREQFDSLDIQNMEKLKDS